MARAPAQRAVRCYLCGNRFEVSPRALSTSCPGCNKAIKIEDVVIKSYLPVIELQTCGRVTVTRSGRIAATRIQCGEGIDCEGVMEGAIETDGDVSLGPHASWKGKVLQSRTLTIAPGAKLAGAINVPWMRAEPKRVARKSDEATKRRSDEGKGGGGERQESTPVPATGNARKPAPKPAERTASKTAPKTAAKAAPKPATKPAPKPAARGAAASTSRSKKS